MTAIATIDWNAKVNEALERADIMAGWSRHFYSISDLSSERADSCPGHGREFGASQAGAPHYPANSTAKPFRSHGLAYG